MLSAEEYAANCEKICPTNLEISEVKDYLTGFSFIVSPTLVKSKKHLIIPHEDRNWQNGTIGVFGIEEKKLLHVIPVSKSRVIRALVTKNEKNLLVIAHKRGSLFNIKVYNIEKDYALVRKIDYPIISIDEGKAGLYVSFNMPMIGIVDITSGKLKKTRKITEKNTVCVDQIKYVEKWNAVATFLDSLNLVMLFDDKLAHIMSKVYLNTEPNNIFVCWSFQAEKCLFISFKKGSSFALEMEDGELKVTREINPQNVIHSLSEINGSGKVIRTHFNQSIAIADSFADERDQEMIVSEKAQNINWTGVLEQSKEIVCCDFREGLVSVMKFELTA